MHRCHVDDASPACCQHRWQRQAGGMKCTGQINCQDGVPFFHWELLHIRHMLDAAVVDQDVHTTKALGGELHHGGDFMGLTHVGPVVVHGHIVRRACSTHRIHSGQVFTKTIEHHIGSLSSQCLSDT